ncbi:MAG: hypothetical protein PHE58_05040, partial [Candidatus Omnitrophica bacterium]|nr:hypothetical protein [Candidatus Omnitrophota bacterium]
YIRGIAGERFCIRNSGLYAVVEGVGDHGCEYMTGGRIVILGATGRNFAAGMSGGIAYVYNQDGTFKNKCNHEMVELQSSLDDEDVVTLKRLISNHYKYTKSARSKIMMDGFHNHLKHFVKVMPLEYKRVLEERKLAEKKELAEVSDG